MGEIFFRPADRRDVGRLMTLADCDGAPHWALTTWQQVLESATKGEQQRVLVAESGEGLIAFGVVGIAGDVAEIESLAVSPAARRCGIGRSLCEALMQWARTRGASRALLEVRVSNDAARSLYESLGFHQIAIRRGYYHEPNEDGLTMAREL